MKHADLIRRITEDGAVLVRSRGGHDIYRNVITGVQQAVPRHREIKEWLARAIIERLAPPGTEAQ